MTSILSAFPFIGEQSFATPGAFNSPLSTISANIAAINRDVGAISGVTISPPSGNTIQMPSDLSISGYLSVGKGVSIGTQAPGTPEPVALTIGVNSGISDYIYFNDSANLRSDYLLGSHAGGTADGLNIFDVSGNTMIVSFSKQSVRFYQQLVAPVVDTGGQVFNVKNYGALGNGVADDSVALQSAINFCGQAGGGIVLLPAGNYSITTTLSIASDRVALVGTGFAPLQINPTRPTVISAAFDGPSIAVTGIRFGVQFDNFSLTGGGAAQSSSIGIDAVNLSEGVFTRLQFDQFGRHAIRLQAGAGGTISNCFAENALTSTQTQANGVFDISSTDMRVYGCFATTGSLGTGVIGNGLKYAWAVRGAQNFFTSCMGDQAHHGWLISAGYNAFAECRAFQNQGNGFILTTAAGENTFLGCKAISNSQNTDNTFSGFSVSGTGNLFVGCLVDGVSGDVNQQSNGFEDRNSNGAGLVVGNHYTTNRIGPTMRGSLYSMTGTSPFAMIGPDVLSLLSGTASAPAMGFASERSLGWYRSAASTMALSYGTVATDNVLVNVAQTINGTLKVQSPSNTQIISNTTTGALGDIHQFFIKRNDAIVWRVGMNIDSNVGHFDIYNDAQASDVLSLHSSSGAVMYRDGAAVTPIVTFLSEKSLGCYRSGVSTLALSYGTLNLATQSVRLSMRTLAASSVTASAANTNVAANEVVFTIGGASGASLCISSGGTTYIFSSALSAKNT